jgi:3-deoxy-manno-octulosonate cytidylyltransferase (CMP-KDO synthetase)
VKKITAIIPARMESTRFPGKPLAKICGHTMIEHMRRRVQLSKTLSEVVVATCNEEIVREVERVGGRAVMTKNTHERCTDRIEEAADKVGGDIIVNVQEIKEQVIYRRKLLTTPPSCFFIPTHAPSTIQPPD